jgi:hypothetical protein
VALADNSVHVDPGSPAGKEYALPLNSARGSDASGGSSASASHGTAGKAAGNGAAAGSSQLFGQGIVSTSHAPKGSSHAPARPTHAAAVPAAPAAAVSPPASGQVIHSGGGGTPWSLLGGALLVIALGGAAGFVLRRRPSA